MAGIDPSSFDGSLGAEQVFLNKVECFLDLIEENIHTEEWETGETVVFDDIGPCPEIEKARSLFGYGETNRGFPVAGYERLCSALKIPFPFELAPRKKQKANKECSALNERSQKSNSEQESAEKPQGDNAKADSAAVTEIGEGVTVADMRALFDPNGPRYRPSLAAAVRLWVSFEHEPVREGMTPKQDCEDRVKELRSPDGIKELWCITENRELLKLVNWDKNGTKFK